MKSHGTGGDREVNLAQARLFAVSINQVVDNLSLRIETLAKRSHSELMAGNLASAKATTAEADNIKRELYEAHRHLVKLHDAFPELLADRGSFQQMQDSTKT